MKDNISIFNKLNESFEGSFKSKQPKKINEGKNYEKYSEEEIKNFLLDGKVIKIGTDKGAYTPTSFYYNGNTLYYYNKEISFGWNPHPNTLEEIVKHIARLNKEGFKVTILDEKPEIRENCEKVDEKVEENNEQADKLIKDYYNNKMDLPELHNKLEKVFGNKKDAVIYLAKNDNRIKNLKEGVNDDVNEAWDILMNMGISEETLRIITAINGYNMETMEDVLYAAFGYRSFDQLEDDIDESCNKEEVKEECNTDKD